MCAGFTNSRLLGIAKVPMALPPGAALPAAGQPPAPIVLASGDYDVWDVFQGKSGGKITLKATLLGPGDAAPNDSSLSTSAEPGRGPAVAAPAAALNHCLQINVIGCEGLPDGACLRAAGMPVSLTRYLAYRFPGAQLSVESGVCNNVGLALEY